MKAHELARSLSALERLPPAARRSDWREICAAIDEPWFDAVWYEQLAKAGHDFGLQVPSKRPAALGVGESWLLLTHANGCDGLTGRLRLLRNVDPDPRLDATGLNAMRDVHHGVLQLLAQNGHQLPPGTRPTSCRLDLSAATSSVEGASLGLATAIALVSLGLDRPPRSDVAASAVVNVAGELKPVLHLDAKVKDLARRRPNVRIVLVAGAQDVPVDVPSSLQVRHCASLAEALDTAGLDVRQLPKAPLDDYLVRLETLLKREAQRSHGPEEWLDLAQQAFECAHALLTEPSCIDSAARGFACAALFAVHGGRDDLARTFHGRVEELGLAVSPAIQAWLAIGNATRAIDGEPEKAASLAEETLAAVRALPMQEQGALLGQALGTLGRAHLHAGRALDALPFLKQAVEHHKAHDPREVPRSMTYLATGLRHAGHVEEATRVIEEALSRVRSAPRWAVSATTERYARLERGRCALERGDAKGSLPDFEFVTEHGGDTDGEHPRISAVRGLHAAYRRLGDAEQARRHLERCLVVAETSEKAIYRKLGVMAIGDALLAGEKLPNDLLEVWERATAVSSRRDAVQEFVERWVY